MSAAPRIPSSKDAAEKKSGMEFRLKNSLKLAGSQKSMKKSIAESLG
jgi:hypothetical protein